MAYGTKRDVNLKVLNWSLKLVGAELLEAKLFI